MKSRYLSAHTVMRRRSLYLKRVRSPFALKSDWREDLYESLHFIGCCVSFNNWQDELQHACGQGQRHT